MHQWPFLGFSVCYHGHLGQINNQGGFYIAPEHEVKLVKLSMCMIPIRSLVEELQQFLLALN